MNTIVALADRVARARRFAFALLASGGLVACSYPDIGPNFVENAKALDAATFECCHDPEKFYPSFIQIGLPLANELGPALSQAAYAQYEETEYPGRLTGKTEAHLEITSRLDPLDIVLTRNNSFTFGRLTPGRFAHALIYLGTEAELRAAGLWNLPALIPHRDAIRAGKVFIEAVQPRVQLDTVARALQADMAAGVRLKNLTLAEKRFAITRLLGNLGTPFNYTLGIDPSGQRYSCTGLIHDAFPNRDFTLRQAYGTTALFPDELAAMAIRDDGIRLLSYVVGTEDGYAHRSRFAMMVDIASYWGFGESE